MGYKCTNPWTSLFIWKDGRVTHCCYSNAGELGNIHQNTIDEIWQGKKLQKIRDEIKKDHYIKAGCEYFCRPYRWSKLYNQNHKIPDGLGRISDINFDQVTATPRIIAMEMDSYCNMSCEHCLGTHYKRTGLPANIIEGLQNYVDKAKIIRVMGGEFSANGRNLSYIESISKRNNQPTIFLNTNGKLPINDYHIHIQNLNSLHMKFSLEGLEDDYEKIRKGLLWTDFELNLNEAKVYFDQRVKEGKDWRLYLNYCVMYSNFEKIPNVLRFAIAKDIPLVINTINGMRHINENLFMYGHLKIDQSIISKVRTEINQILSESDYCFEDDFRDHFDYIIESLEFKKIKLSKGTIEKIVERMSGIKADRFLYLIYRWQQSPLGAIGYLSNKVKKRLRSYIS